MWNGSKNIMPPQRTRAPLPEELFAVACDVGPDWLAVELADTEPPTLPYATALPPPSDTEE